MDKKVSLNMRFSDSKELPKFYTYIDDDSNLWLIAEQPNMADNIYFCSFDPKSEGFGGGTVMFNLLDGETIELPGPWHSNADALFSVTGIDIRDRHLSYVVIAEQSEPVIGGYLDYIFKNILYEDTEPTVGLFNRGTIMAREFAKKLGKPVFLLRVGTNGGSHGPVRPDDKDPD